MRHVQRLKAKVLKRPALPGGSMTGQANPTTNTPRPLHQHANLSSTESTEQSIEKHGLFKLAEGKPNPSGSSNYPVDIIAVHGLNGDAFSTWRHHQDGTLWLRDLLPEFLPGCRVYTYGYPSKIFSQSSARATKNRGLYWASRSGYDRILTSLLEAGAEPNSSDVDGQTALTIASEHGNLACVVKLLADERTDLNMPGPRGRNALSLACGGGHNDIVNKLLSKGCSADDPDNSGATPFFCAVGGEHHTIMSTLARIRSVDINHRDKAGRTAISWAAGDGMADTLARLLKFPGIDVNLADNKGKSPLSWAAGNGCVDTVEVLLRSRKVNKASCDNDKRNAISWASGGGHHITLAKLLYGGCPGVDAEDIDNWTPLAWAIETNTPETVQALINTGLVQIDRRDGGGRTALSWAVDYGHKEVVKVLLQAGADLEAESDKRSTPISIAKQLGRDDLLSVLTIFIFDTIDFTKAAGLLNRSQNIISMDYLLPSVAFDLMISNFESQ
ncbi:ankyrin [Trichoderma asperelloides]|nr:ankyrin [Trichoderma asperelloides]